MRIYYATGVTTLIYCILGIVEGRLNDHSNFTEYHTGIYSKGGNYEYEEIVETKIKSQVVSHMKMTDNGKGIGKTSCFDSNLQNLESNGETKYGLVKSDSISRGHCRFRKQSLNTFDQFGTNLVQHATGSLTGFVGEAVLDSVPVVGDILAEFLVPLASDLFLKHSGVALATDPNEYRFTAIEDHLECLNKEIDDIWNEFDAIKEDLKKIQRNFHKQFFADYVITLDTINCEIKSHMLNIKRCLRTGKGKFLYDTLCGPQPFFTVVTWLTHYSSLLGQLVDKAGSLYIQTGKPNQDDYPETVFGTITEVPDFDCDGGGTINYNSLNYDVTRKFLSEVAEIAQVLTLSFAQAKDWARVRDLIRNPSIFEVVFGNILRSIHKINTDMQSFYDALNSKSDEHGDLTKQRIRSTDRLNGKIFCVRNLILKDDAPDWCENKQPDGWYDHASNVQCSNEGARGCWIGDGNCSKVNFCEQCIDWGATEPSAGSLYDCLYSHSNTCVDGERGLPIPDDNDQVYPFNGPMNIKCGNEVGEYGAPIDPIASELAGLKRAIAYADSFYSYWSIEKQYLEGVINPHCQKNMASIGGVTYPVCPEFSQNICCNSKGGFKSITDKVQCGSREYTSSSNYCLCPRKKESHTRRGRFASCGTESYKCGQKCCNFFCYSSCDKHCTRYKMCDQHSYIWVDDTCDVANTCDVADDCKCELC